MTLIDELNKVDNKKLLALYREITEANINDDFVLSSYLVHLIESSEYFNKTAKMEDVDNSIKAEIINRFNARLIQ